MLLLAGFIANISHAYVIDCNHQHTIKEYVEEFSAPIHHDDGCETHFMYHQSFIVQKNSLYIMPLRFSRKIETSIDRIFSIYLKIPPKPPKFS